MTTSQVPETRADGPLISPMKFRAAMGRVPTSLAVAATMVDGQPVGMLVGSFTSISLDPLLVGFFADLRSRTYDQIKSAERVAFSILGQQSGPVCDAFRLPADERFDTIDWNLSEQGNPVVDDAVLVVEGSIAQRVPLGDHDLVVVSVQRIWENSHFSARPLVFHEGRMGRLDAGQWGSRHLAHLDWTL